MTSAYRAFCLISKAAFGAALTGFVLLAAMILLFSGFLNPGEGNRLFLGMFCGGAYLVGSIFSIGERFGATTMVCLGILLNLFGAVYWVPSWGSSESYIAVIGVALTLLWCVCIVLRIASAKS